MTESFMQALKAMKQLKNLDGSESPEEVQQVTRVLFDFIDANKDGRIEHHEYTAVLLEYQNYQMEKEDTPEDERAAKLEAFKEEAKVTTSIMFSKVDSNSDGTIDFDEFVTFIME